VRVFFAVVLLALACEPIDHPVTDTDAAISLEWPVPLDEIGSIICVDHDPVDYAWPDYDCVDYLGRYGFPYCYDQHMGTDFILADEWTAMDRGVPVFAALGGTVIGTVDGNYDRCRIALDLTINCDGHELANNNIYIDHGDGLVTGYLHLKARSLLVSDGDEVEADEQIAEVGSSGLSARPHLHFEATQDGLVIDPYEGWWVDKK